MATALLATSPMLPMAWDEGITILRAEGIAHWAQRWRPASWVAATAGPLSEAAIAQDWQYTTVLEGHPALPGIVIAAGRAASQRWLSPLTSARFGPIVLFAIAAGAMFYRVARQWSLLAATAAAGTLLLLPRLFAHAHFAGLDGPLTACWILAWAAFAPARRGLAPAILWGLLLGMTLSAKFTGWIAPLPFIVAALFCRDRGTWRALVFGLPVALLTFWLLNPPLWHHPLAGGAEFFRLNLHRGENPGLNLNIGILFLGRMYDLEHSLPWYNTLVWTGITVPVGLLLLSLVGLPVLLWEQRWRVTGGGGWERDGRPWIRMGRGVAHAPAEPAAAGGCTHVSPATGHPPPATAFSPPGLLLLLQWGVLMIVRALPGAPPHDGVRLFLPSFAFLAAIAGVGAAWMWEGGRGGDGETRRQGDKETGCPPYRRALRSPCLFTSACLLAIIFVTSATSVFLYAPQWLSYYNLFIGGLPGATALGMEPTYYWDALDAETLTWLDQHTPPGAKVAFAMAPPENLEWLSRWGQLRVEYREEAPGSFRWYVLQRRPSAWQPADKWLLAHGHPAFQKAIRGGGWGFWRLAQPLVEVYPYAEYKTACQAPDTVEKGHSGKD